MFWIFRAKKEFENLREETKNSFQAVRNDTQNIGKWIKHLNSVDSDVQTAISDLKEQLSTIEKEIEGLKNMIAFLDDGLKNLKDKQLFKTPPAVLSKQTAVGAVEVVQTPVQTPVQTAKFYDFQTLSVMERAIVWILLNTELKLSYDDVATMTGKDRSTVRGQINSIKQKSVGLIKEVMEKNGKKRVFIPEEIREKILKKVKVRINEKEKNDKGAKK
jgi:septal ring factor EnvC (AmiA/AmiB activator)